ncbi:MAG: hypothetical protein COA79_24845 [Planctomycetota bacterium]|nr:MAG: hypothetical protein COA79_24845 [Planctomycetota bacterium]
MTQVDQFESVFRSALKESFKYENIQFQKILVFTDLVETEGNEFLTNIKNFLSALSNAKNIEFILIHGVDRKSTSDLIKLIDDYKPDLICSYRNLYSGAWQFPHSLGEHLDVLLQKTSVPVLVLPHPKSGYQSDHAIENTNNVIAMIEHLETDSKIINTAVSFTEKNGQLTLIHIEDEIVFDRYINVISKISSIDTDDAKKKIAQKLMSEPNDYIKSCQQKLSEQGIEIEVKALVKFGHHLSEYKQNIENHKVDLFVMNTKDNDQMAMHGMAYPLAIELRHIPLLML